MYVLSKEISGFPIVGIDIIPSRRLKSVVEDVVYIWIV